MTTLICDCNQTMPLDASALGAALNETLPVHSCLCRREAAAFIKAASSSDELVVACTQETRLFSELAEQAKPASLIRFVNLRETGGWSREATQSGPKLAALLAVAHLPMPEPIASVTFKSAGRVLIIGELGAAEQAADLLDPSFQVTLFALGAASGLASQERRYPVLGGKIQQLSGWLGSFTLTWVQNNPIDLDLCTRCNACLTVCPVDAIGLDYQIDLQICDASRTCVKVCKVAGAINFNRATPPQSENFDLVLDLRAAPAFTQHTLPQGYLRWDGRDLKAFLQWSALVGEFEKPQFVSYKQKLCAHSRNDKIACSACIDVCSASAIRSDHKRQQISVNASLCVGCGTCSSLCPTGALSFAYPRASDQGVKIKTLLATYLRSGGKNAALLLHSQGAGASLLGDLGRAAQLERADNDGTYGLPSRVLPLAMWHTSSVGLELWLSALAYGANQVWILLTHEEAPQYVAAMREQLAVAQAIVSGLGFDGEHFRLLHARDARDLASLDRSLQAAPAQGVGHPASFAVQTDKRSTLSLALDHLMQQAPVKTGVITLPTAGSALGALALNPETCTLCLSCVNACPAAALQDNPQALQLRLIEKNCVQCGLCVKTCPENALNLVPRLNLSPQRNESVLLHEMQPYACLRCGKPFGTLKAIEAMLGKLQGHSMFQGSALERLKMCADCRVIDLYGADNEIQITPITP